MDPNDDGNLLYVPRLRTRTGCSLGVFQDAQSENFELLTL